MRRLGLLLGRVCTVSITNAGETSWCGGLKDRVEKSLDLWPGRCILAVEAALHYPTRQNFVAEQAPDTSSED